MSKRHITAFFAPVARNKKPRLDLSSSIPPSIHPGYPFPIASLPATLRFSTRPKQDTDGGEPKSSADGEPEEIGPLVLNDKPDLDMLHFHPFLHKELARELYLFLRRELPFYRVTYKIKREGIDTTVNTPRYTSLFGVDATSIFHPDTGVLLDAKTKLSAKHGYATCAPRPIPQCLRSLLEHVEKRTNSAYNFLLVNYYANGSDSISFHSDDESFLGENPTIASMTLGSTRDFVMKHKSLLEQKLSLPLAQGDLLVMKGTTQSRWLHSVPKRKEAGPRINLTFRHAKTKAGTANYYRYNVGTGPVYRWDEEAGEMRIWTDEREKRKEDIGKKEEGEKVLEGDS
ncbi:hypothetical protein FN846DRAFT_953490 [Sphaerosporella brunnea]|uniref:Fe2OG dioxygenase domain-containing protein n=1 Tax=Sphaerosporella brunnea TaxID=1250544 RepID=A0A5J5EUY7_9PEZI|nr:hypothetical protein FN846DRAFT_953490 [Sphaerosporella brunnea]